MSTRAKVVCGTDSVAGLCPAFHEYDPYFLTIFGQKAFSFFFFIGNYYYRKILPRHSWICEWGSKLFGQGMAEIHPLS